MPAKAVRPAAKSAGKDYETELVAQVSDGLHAWLSAVRDSGRPLESLGTPAELAQRILAAAPLAPSPLEELVGPFYNTPSLREWLHVSRQALNQRVQNHTLLGLPTDDGTVYPAWQFTRDRQTIPHLSRVLRVLASGTDEPWTWALWLTAPDDDRDGQTAWQWLAAGRDPEPVLREARADAARWAA